MKKRIIIPVVTALILGAVFFLQNKTEVSESTHVQTPVTEVATEESQKVSSVSKDVSKSREEQRIQDEIREELSEALGDLPTFSDLKGLSDDEVHHTPEVITQSGKLIGRLLSEAEQEPHRREETLKFFLACAEDEKLVTAVRAVCWKSTLNQIPKWKIFLPISGAKVSNDIRELATRLP